MSSQEKICSQYHESMIFWINYMEKETFALVIGRSVCHQILTPMQNSLCYSGRSRRLNFMLCLLGYVMPRQLPKIDAACVQGLGEDSPICSAYIDDSIVYSSFLAKHTLLISVKSFNAYVMST